MRGVNILQKVKIALWIVLITLIQSVFVPYINIFGITPNLLFIFSLCYAGVSKNIKSIMIISAVCGAIADCMTGRIFGVYVFIYLISALLIFLILEGVFSDNKLLFTVIVFVTTIFGETIFYLINIGVLKETKYIEVLFDTILPLAVINTLFSVILKVILKKSFKVKRGGYR